MAASRRRTRSEPGRPTATNGSGSRSPLCPWAHIRSPQVRRGSDRFSSAVIHPSSRRDAGATTDATIVGASDEGSRTLAMMNHRALARAHTHWRPHRAVPAPPAERPAAAGRRASRPVWLTAVAALLAGLAIVFVLLGTGGSAGPRLPATPRAWLEAFSADVATGSTEVCSRLLSPTFTSELEREVQSS